MSESVAMPGIRSNGVGAFIQVVIQKQVNEAPNQRSRQQAKGHPPDTEPPGKRQAQQEQSDSRARQCPRKRGLLINSEHIREPRQPPLRGKLDRPAQVIAEANRDLE